MLRHGDDALRPGARRAVQAGLGEEAIFGPRLGQLVEHALVKRALRGPAPAGVKVAFNNSPCLLGFIS